MNLRAKLLLPLVAVFAVIAAVLQFVALPRALSDTRAQFHGRMGERVGAASESLATALATNRPDVLQTHADAMYATHPQWLQMVVVVGDSVAFNAGSAETGSALVSTLKDSPPGDVASIDMKARVSGISREGIGSVRPIVGEDGQTIGRLAVVGNIDQELALVHKTFRSFLALLFTAMFVCLAVMALLTSTVIVRPMRSLALATERLSRREFAHVELPKVKGRDEISHVVSHFARLRDAFRTHQDEQRQSAFAIRDLAFSDPISGLPNKAFILNRLEAALDRSRASGSSVGLMFVDIDDFKSVNDFVGHHTGDRYLREFAHRVVVTVLGQDALVCEIENMRDGLVDQDVCVARYGADAFVILFDNNSDSEDLEAIAHQIQQATVEQFAADGQTLSLTASIGISVAPEHGESVDRLIQHADTALHAAKARSRGDIRVFSDTLDSRTFRRLSLESSLHDATRNSEFDLHYQAKVDLRSGVINGVEALARWDHPMHGKVSPAEFIPMSEHTGAIVELGEWVIRQACQQALDWQRAGMPAIRVAVNLSPRQLGDVGIVDAVSNALTSTGLSPELLELELTEGALIADPDRAAAVLDNLKSLGVYLSVDDFGTGYSSLSYLHRFPIDSVKIDQSFVSALTTDASSQAIVTAIISMARSLDLTVVAEGVETAEQLAFLQGSGCDDVQGFFLSNPVPPKQFESEFEDTVSWTLSAVREIAAKGNVTAPVFHRPN